MVLRAHPVRPQLFSLLLFALLLTLVARSDKTGSWRPLALAPVVMIVWVNCHGGWIVGLAVLGLWISMTALSAPWRDRIVLAGVLAASAAATLVNPYGFGLWHFLSTTVRLERTLISDWQPLYSLPVRLLEPVDRGFRAHRSRRASERERVPASGTLRSQSCSG